MGSQHADGPGQQLLAPGHPDALVLDPAHAELVQIVRVHPADGMVVVVVMVVVMGNASAASYCGTAGRTTAATAATLCVLLKEGNRRLAGP